MIYLEWVPRDSGIDSKAPRVPGFGRRAGSHLERFALLPQQTADELAISEANEGRKRKMGLE